LLLIKRQQTVWDCDGRCVLLSEAGKEMQPPQFPHAKAVDRDFSDLALFNGKLFTLERNAFQICRRDAQTAKVERCWSYAAELLQANRRYSQNFGLEEALIVDAEGVDRRRQQFRRRADGEFGRSSGASPRLKVAGAPSRESATAGQARRPGVDDLAWCAALFLATRFFGQWEERQQNPNVVVTSEQHDGVVEVKLAGNAQGHFVASGRSTGGVHARYRRHRCGDPGGSGQTLETGRRFRCDPEHGQRPEPGLPDKDRPPATGRHRAADVRALVAPGLHGDQVLLGMSALNKLEFTQRGGTMLLRQTTK
jgi:hypothetical protein